MSQHCRANPCCGDRPCSGVPIPQHASGLPWHNERPKREPTPTPQPNVDAHAEALARQIWGYFKGDSTGGTTAMQWFDNNKSLGGPAHIIELCRKAMNPSPQPNVLTQVPLPESGESVEGGE